VHTINIDTRKARRECQKEISAKAVRLFGTFVRSKELERFDLRKNLINGSLSDKVYELYCLMDDKYPLSVYEEGRACPIQPALSSIPYANGYYYGGIIDGSSRQGNLQEFTAAMHATSVHQEFKSTIGLYVNYNDSLAAVSYTKRGGKNHAVRIRHFGKTSHKDTAFLALDFLMEIAKEIAEPLQAISNNRITGNTLIEKV
jgi:hypothetical protein